MSFGFGLSYTNFEYKDLKVSSEGVKFIVKNTGNVAGTEITQLYVGKQSDTIFRPVRELKGFKRVELEPGEEKEEIPEYFSGQIKDISDEKFTRLYGREILDGSWSGEIRMNDAVCQLYYGKALATKGKHPNWLLGGVFPTTYILGGEFLS